MVVLPALLLLAAGCGLGCYYETNDDLAITQLLRGASAGAPVTDLHLYFHGLAKLLALGYKAAPGWPWYGLVLYSLLYLATVAAFAVLDQLLRPRVSAVWLTLGLVLFFAVAWLEHGLWFNYSRVPILLSGTGVLLAAQLGRHKRFVVLGLCMVGVAWLIRPSMAMLGLLAAAPGAWWLGGKLGGRVLALAVGGLVVGSVALALTNTPETATYRTLDVFKSNRNDYQLYHALPRTSADILGVQALDNWLLGDSVTVNEAFFRRAMRFDLGRFTQHQAPIKLRVVGALLLRDYFPLLLGQVVLGWLVWRRGKLRAFWLIQLAYAALVLGLGIVLKLPPRVGLPLMDLWVLSNLAYVLTCVKPRLSARAVRVMGVCALVAVALYGYKTLHRVVVLRRERAAHEAYLTQVRRIVDNRIIVTAGLETAYKGLSPFKVYDVSQRPILSLVGWTTLDPANAALRKQLTGTRDLPVALQRLTKRPDVAWLLTPPMARFLAYYLPARTGLNHQTWRFKPQSRLSPDTLLPELYQVDVKPVKQP